MAKMNDRRSKYEKRHEEKLDKIEVDKKL